jgi:hypothetical protein
MDASFKMTKQEPRIHWTISTLRGYGLLLFVTPLIAGGLEAGGFSRISPKPWHAKG